MKSIPQKDRRAAVVQHLLLSHEHELEELDDADSEFLAGMVETLTKSRKGVVNSKVTNVNKRRESAKAPLQTTTAVNLALHALDSIASAAHMDNRRLANAFREVRKALLDMMRDASVAPPTAPPGGWFATAPTKDK